MLVSNLLKEYYERVGVQLATCDEFGHINYANCMQGREFDMLSNYIRRTKVDSILKQILGDD